MTAMFALRFVELDEAIFLIVGGDPFGQFNSMVSNWAVGIRDRGDGHVPFVGPGQFSQV